jgi:hypothetical protein
MVAAAAASATDILIRAADIAPAAIVGDWVRESDTTAADGIRIHNPNRGAVKASASATPASYFEATFIAQAGTPYHLWLRMKADNDSYSNDSVSVQFNGAVDGAGAPVFQIGTSGAASVILEEGTGAGVHGWGWNDDRYGGLGNPIWFQRSGAQTIRIQVREDGVSIDQIVLSPGTWLTTSPGALKDDQTIVAR